MAVYELTLANLEHLDDGRAALAFKAALSRAVGDCYDRPGDKTARKVVFQVEVLPVMADGELDSVDVAFQVKDTVPTRKTRVYNMAVRGANKLAFNDLSDDSAHQRTIDMTKEDDE